MLFFGGRGGDTQEDQDGAIEPQDILIGKPARQLPDLCFWSRGDLVHHQPGRGAKSIGGAGLDKEPEKRRIGGIGGEGANGDRSGLVKALVLKDDHGTRLAGVIFAVGSGPNLAAPHSPFLGEAGPSEMAPSERSEERRVGKECGSRLGAGHLKKESTK